MRGGSPIQPVTATPVTPSRRAAAERLQVVNFAPRSSALSLKPNARASEFRLAMTVSRPTPPRDDPSRPGGKRRPMLTSLNAFGGLSAAELLRLFGSNSPSSAPSSSATSTSPAQSASPAVSAADADDPLKKIKSILASAQMAQFSTAPSAGNRLAARWSRPPMLSRRGAATRFPLTAPMVRPSGAAANERSRLRFKQGPPPPNRRPT